MMKAKRRVAKTVIFQRRRKADERATRRLVQRKKKTLLKTVNLKVLMNSYHSYSYLFLAAFFPSYFLGSNELAH